MRVYLDVCCLHRPFDDQAQERIRLESEAVKLVFDLHAKGRLMWVSSEAVEDEVLRNPDNHKRLAVWGVLNGADERLMVREEELTVARQWQDRGLSVIDALHLALAEAGNCDILLTTDDSFVRKAGEMQPPPRGRVENPAKWVLEFIES